MATLNRIRTKVRRITKRPSVSQITDAEIDEYVNDFILYDFPENLRLFALRTTFQFSCKPYIDLYENSLVVGDDFYQFKDIYTTLHDPVYIGGRQAFFSQSREEFYNMWPQNAAIAQIATGDGVNLNYAGVLPNVPVLRNNVAFTSVDINNDGLSLVDDGQGALVGTGNGVINYVTGQYVFLYNTAPAANTAINSQTVPYAPSRPDSLLYYDNKIIIRPVPDQPYVIDIEAYKRPNALLAAGQSPELEQWWQYIAVGTAKKIFEDTLDIEGIIQITPTLEQYESQVERRTIVQQSNQRAATIYTQGISYGRGSNFFNNPW